MIQMLESPDEDFKISMIGKLKKIQKKMDNDRRKHGNFRPGTIIYKRVKWTFQN